MEDNYYSKKIPKTGCYPKLPWPLLCYHCGSDCEVSFPESSRSTVFPQCAACVLAGKQPHEAGKSIHNDKAAEHAKNKKQKQAEDQENHGQHRNKLCLLG